MTDAKTADERHPAHDEPRWCRFKNHQVIFECELDEDRPGQTRPKRCLSREERCKAEFNCVFAGGNGDPFHGSI